MTATFPAERPPKRALLDDSDSESDGGVPVNGKGLRINEEYAERFEYNKKREEKARLADKYGVVEDDDSGSSSDETEDDDAFFVTEELDAQISATLEAIRNKDPRVYNTEAKFYTEALEVDAGGAKKRKEKPVFLQDYHRQRLLKGDIGNADEEDATAERPKTYHEEQEVLKKTLLTEIDAAMAGDSGDSDDDGAFIERKTKEEKSVLEGGVHPSRAAAIKLTELDVKNADKNPDVFLSNFMASRAWVPEDGSNWKPFASDEEDDDDDDDDDDKWEHAYNMRFEDPDKSNEVLVSYSRSVTNAKSVRRGEKTGRKRKRDQEKEHREEEKRQRREEKARLRRLKIEEAEEKLKKFRRAAGIRGKDVRDDELVKLLDEEWDNNKWEEVMKRRFDEEYYAQADNPSGSDEEGEKKRGKRPKKPKWDDDIDIVDIIPDFDEDENGHSEGEEEEDEDEDSARPSKKRKTTKDRKKDRIAAKRDARQTRSKVEALVDVRMNLDHHDLLDPATAAAAANADADADADADAKSHPPAPHFRYREVSPTSFGLTARDILLAPSDATLNEFAGLKKLAPYRDVQKKQLDRKRLGKKARLRQWRRETFGKEFERTGPTYEFDGVKNDDGMGGMGEARSGFEPKGGEETKGKRKRSKKRKDGVGTGDN